MLYAVDMLDWAGVRACLADEVRTDYTDLFGGEVETLTGDALVERWQGLLPGFAATQHMSGQILVDDGPDGVQLSTHVRSYHHVDGETWAVHGHYVVPVERSAGGWRIAGITLRVFYQEGNRDLPEVALKRATTSPRAAASNQPDGGPRVTRS